MNEGGEVAGVRGDGAGGLLGGKLGVRAADERRQFFGGRSIFGLRVAQSARLGGKQQPEGGADDFAFVVEPPRLENLSK